METHRAGSHGSLKPVSTDKSLTQEGNVQQRGTNHMTGENDSTWANDILFSWTGRANAADTVAKCHSQPLL